MPGGIKALFATLPAAGIIFAFFGFDQANQLAGEIKNPQRNVPQAIIISVLVATGIYFLLQVAFIGAMPASRSAQGFTSITNTNILSGPVAGLAGILGLSGWLAFILRVDAFVSAAGTGLIYTTGTSRVSYGLARNRYFPQTFSELSSNRIPWVGLIAGYVIGLFFLLPFPSWHSLVGLITGASVLMYAGAPLSLGAFRRQVPDAPRPFRLSAAGVLAPLRVHRRRPAHLLVGLRGGLEARHRPDHRVRDHRRLYGVRPATAAAGVEVGDMAAGVADRPGHHLLAGPVQRERRHAPAAADQHVQHPVLVGHPDRGRLQPDHLLLGDARQAAARGDARAGQPGRPESRNYWMPASATEPRPRLFQGGVAL